MRPTAAEPETLWCGPIQRRYSSNRSANLASSNGPMSTSRVGSPTGAAATAALNAATNSSCRDSCTRTVPREVQRWPAVPNPANSAPSTARSRRADGVTTIGFLPPSSRQGDCRCRPHSSPIAVPTAVDPVKPTLSTRPASSASARPLNVAAPSALTTCRTPSGRPARWNIPASASPQAAAYSAGFHTTVLPVSNAGTRYQEGTATGKLPAVTTATTPTGLRKVNSCLSGISLGTVSPYSRRPSPRKKSHVSMISRTSPSASAYGLPTSAVTSRARASAFASTIRPAWPIARPRTGAGTSAQPGCAARAFRQAVTKAVASPSSTSATTSFRRAGFVDWYRISARLRSVLGVQPPDPDRAGQRQVARRVAGEDLVAPVGHDELM